MLEQISALSPVLSAIVCGALFLGFLIGWNDAANSIATIVATRVFTPFQAVTLAACSNFLGALVGIAVFQMIVAGLFRIDPMFVSNQDLLLIIASTVSASILWTGAMTIFSIPISGTHSILGALVGPLYLAGGTGIFIKSGVILALGAFFLAPIIGLLVAFLLTLILSWMIYRFHNRVVDGSFRVLQIGSAAALAFFHGVNDAQKVVALITLALIAGGVQFLTASDILYPDERVRISAAVALGIGTAIGGWRILQSFGMNLSKLKPFDGFCAEAASSLVLSFGASMGVPVSTTHTTTGAIMGVGFKSGARSLRWGIGRRILATWLVTVPANAVISGAIYLVFKQL